MHCKLDFELMLHQQNSNILVECYYCTPAKSLYNNLKNENCGSIDDTLFISSVYI